MNDHMIRFRGFYLFLGHALLQTIDPVVHVTSVHGATAEERNKYYVECFCDDQPTDPSNDTASNFCASTANSIGSWFSTSLQ